jgi:hypothetical protein
VELYVPRLNNSKQSARHATNTEAKCGNFTYATTPQSVGHTSVDRSADCPLNHFHHPSRFAFRAAGTQTVHLIALKLFLAPPFLAVLLQLVAQGAFAHA